MKVCVIGAGPSGLTTIKQLRDEGHQVVCFEKSDNIGGIWYRHENDSNEMKVFDSLILSISMKLMSYSDYIYKGKRKFSNHKGYMNYLEEYADFYHLRDYIRLQSNVDNISYCDGQWSVMVYSNGERVSHEFEALALCSGTFQTPNNDIPELKNFKGEIVHSMHYRNKERFKDKRVLVVGLAESGADIVREISDVSSECTLTLRSRSFLLPRLAYGKYSTDMMTHRAHHFEMWKRATDEPVPMQTIWGSTFWSRYLFFGALTIYAIFMLLIDFMLKPFRRETKCSNTEVTNNLGQAAYPEKLDIDTENSQENLDAINQWNRKSHGGVSNWSMRIIFSKNVSFIPNIVKGKIKVNEGGIEKSEGSTVYFKDKTAKDFDVIMLCTGFVKDYSILGDHVEIKDNNVRNLYKHAFHPDFNGRFALIGAVRPFSGGIPICSEMQARYFSLLCSNKLKLPDNVHERIQKEKNWEELRCSLSPRHTEAIPSQIFFLDSIAKEIGCMMPIRKLILRPKLMLKLWFFSFNQTCYRLTGPHSMKAYAKAEILNERLPADSKKLGVAFHLLSFFPSRRHPEYADYKKSVNDIFQK